jgi:hypothetical protein
VIQVKEAEIRGRNEKIKALDTLLLEEQSKFITISKEIASLKISVNSAHMTIKDREKEIQSLKDTIAQKNRDINQYKTFSTKLRGLEEAVTLGAFLYQGQRFYRSGRDETTPAAYLSLFINYSLFQLCAAIIQDNESLKIAMRFNLYTISTKLKELLGENQAYGFKDVIKTLGHNTPDQARALARVDESHRDGELFRSVLSYMRNSQSIQLAPFYLASDQPGQVYIAN